MNVAKQVFIELEGVVADIDHRAFYKSDFVEYNRRAEDDKPFPYIKTFLDALNEQYDIIIFSMRQERFRVLTEDWLIANEIPCEELILKRYGETRPHNETVLSWIQHRHNGSTKRALYNVEFIMVNNESTVETLREEGFTVFQTNWS